MIFLGQDGDQSVTTHELAHMWFYGLVGDDQELHPWMDEAFATAAEEIVDDELFGGTAEPGSGPNGGNDPRPVDLPVSAFEHDLAGYNTVVYFKGADALIGARQAAGRRAFDNGAALLRERVRLAGGLPGRLRPGHERAAEGPARAPQGRRDPLTGTSVPGQHLVQPPHAFGEVLVAERVRHPERARRAEGLAGHHGHADLFQHQRGELRRGLRRCARRSACRAAPRRPGSSRTRLPAAGR